MARGTSALATVLVLLFIHAPQVRPQAGATRVPEDTQVNVSRGRHLGTQNSVGDLLRHPAFAGFGRLILPWDDRACDEQMLLTRVGSLLPYHTRVDPDTVVGGLNRLIDDAASGKIVYYRLKCYPSLGKHTGPASG